MSRVQLAEAKANNALDNLKRTSRSLQSLTRVGSNPQILKQVAPASPKVNVQIYGFESVYNWNDSSLFNKLKINYTIGEGVFGKVFNVSTSTQEKLAVKQISFDTHENLIQLTPTSKHEIERKMMELTNIRSLHLNRYFGGNWKKDRVYWIFMEYAGGKSVSSTIDPKHRLKNRPYLEKQIGVILYFTLRALVDLHAVPEPYGIHGDLKMNNILVTKQGDIKISDYGVTQIFCVSQDSVAPALGKQFVFFFIYNSGLWNWRF